MKKSIALVAMAFGVTSAFAQDLTSKKGEPFLPEAGDYAIGIDANPYLNYLGNFFGKSGSNPATPNFTFSNFNQTITGKKYIDATSAYRVSVNLGFENYSGKGMVNDRSVATAPVYPALPTKVENKYKNSATKVGISLGKEFRRGKTRLQGIYGAEAGLGLGMSSSKYTYGNTLNATATVPVFVDPTTGGDAMDGGANITTDSYGNNARITKFKKGLEFSIGARAFVGAEYFILPKISLAGEFGWGLGLTLNGKSKTSMESTSGTVVGTQEKVEAKSTDFILGTDDKNAFFGPSASLRLNLHF